MIEGRPALRWFPILWKVYFRQFVIDGNVSIHQCFYSGLYCTRAQLLASQFNQVFEAIRRGMKFIQTCLEDSPQSTTRAKTQVLHSISFYDARST